MGWIRIESIKKFPSSAGLYAIYLIENNKLLYLGSSGNLYVRFFNYGGGGSGGHCGYRRIVADVSSEKLYFKYKTTNELWMENILIRRLKPLYNKKNTSELIRHSRKNNKWPRDYNG